MFIRQGENCAVYGNFFLTDEDVPATDNPIKLLRFRQDVIIKWVHGNKVYVRMLHLFSKPDCVA